MPQMLKCVILQVGCCGKLRRAGTPGPGVSTQGMGLMRKTLNRTQMLEKASGRGLKIFFGLYIHSFIF